jgi:Transglycosylase SLT domain
MRLSDSRAAPPRRGKLARALVMAAALLTSPWTAPEAAAARAGKAQASHAPKAGHAQGSKTQGGKPQAARGHASRHAPAVARPARQTARRGQAKPPRQAVAVAPMPAEDIPGVRRVVVSALDGAIRSTGIDATLLTALAWQESRFDPRARNRRFTARGLMQFTEATWLEAVRDHGPQHGLRYEAAVLSTDPASGSITTRQPRTRSRILELRDNPRYAAALAAARINRARIALAQSLGRPVGPADLYLVHLLGPAGAQRFLAALDRTPGKPAADYVAAESMALNREVFVERGTDRKLSLAEVHAWVDRSIAGQRSMHAPLFTALGTPAVVEVADAR